MIARLRDHVSAKLAAGTIEQSPFPHMIVSGFFPDDIFEQIMRHNLFNQNAGREWMGKSATGSVTGRTPYHARKQINFHSGDSYDATPEARAFWSDITATFLDDDWFARRVYDTYPEFFRMRFGDLVDDDDFFAMFREELFLQRHEPGYHIGPHTDIPTRVFTCIFSFAETSGFEAFGTQLLKPKDRLDRCWGNDHYPFDDFTVAKVAPYAPNNFLLFFKTRHSFHSVMAIDETVPNQRYGMQFQFYEQAGGLFRDRSRPDLMAVRTPGRASLARRLLARAGL